MNSIDEQLKSNLNSSVIGLLEFFINLSTHMSSQEKLDRNIREIIKYISNHKQEFEDLQKEFKELENELNR